MPEPTDAEIRKKVRERYAAAAKTSLPCVSVDARSSAQHPTAVGAAQHPGMVLSATAVDASLGCGVPTAVADIHEGETVLDVGSGAGADVLISARGAGATGKAIGLDMTDEMLELAHTNAAEAGIANVEFIKGYIEDISLADGSVDVVVSNCVINLAADKRRVLAETVRVLRPWAGQLPGNDERSSTGLCIQGQGHGIVAGEHVAHLLR